MTIDRSTGMQQICNELQKRNIDLSKLNALEVFAREGNWQTFVYADKVKSIEAWEINPEFEKELRKNLPKARIEIADSIKKLRDNKSLKFDFIVIDNPQGTFGEENQYCEHFDILNHISNIVDYEAIVIFNINKEPFSYQNFPEWKSRREKFYQKPDTAKLSIDFLAEFYRNFFKNINLETKFMFNVFREECKPLDYLHYFVFHLIRK